VLLYYPLQHEKPNMISLGVSRIATRIGLLHTRLKCLTEPLLDERGQDLVEYIFVVALIALAATAGMSGIATSISKVFSAVGSRLAAATS
jgi:Flp pilus assembly pilin Flp